MTAPLQRENLSCLHDKVLIGEHNILLLYTDTVMRDLTVEQQIYTEWNSAQPTIQSQHSIDPSHTPQQMHSMPYIAFA